MTVAATPLAILLIDNYDSFTYNLYQLLMIENSGYPPTVIRNDDTETWKRYASHVEAFPFDCIVISPGPGTCTRAEDFGICREALRTYHMRVPLLGVCLGFQGIAQMFGAEIVQTHPMHGRISKLTLLQKHSRLFEGLASHINHSGLNVCRYHSLAVRFPTPLLNQNLIITSMAENVPMSLEHTVYPLFGVQFHPESVASEGGHYLIANFFRHATEWNLKARPNDQCCLENRPLRQHLGARQMELSPYLKQPKQPPRHGVVLRRVSRTVQLPVSSSDSDPEFRLFGERLFSELYGDAAHAIWLDSSGGLQGVNGDTPRYSYMGAASGPLAELLECWTPGSTTVSSCGIFPSKTYEDARNIFSVLKARLSAFAALIDVAQQKEPIDRCTPKFHGGYVGFFGYECRFDSVKQLLNLATSSSALSLLGKPSTYQCDSCIPLASWMFVDRVLTLDHLCGTVTLSCFLPLAPSPTERQAESSLGEEPLLWKLLHEPESFSGNTTATAFLATVNTQWLHMTTERVSALRTFCPCASLCLPTLPSLPRFTVRDPRSLYEAKVRRALQLLKSGVNYQLCLTTQLVAHGPFRHGANDATQFWEQSLRRYLQLRRHNPAPYSCYIRCWSGTSAALDKTARFCIECLSPECFLEATGGGASDQNVTLQMSPIKGTASRDLNDPVMDAKLRQGLSESEKDRAENLMILDLIRNDLGTVCCAGTVTIPQYLEAVSFTHVHHLVSTARGKLDTTKHHVVDAVAACFPGGSMTGAPKIKAIHMLNELEGQHPRGPYSGTLGFFSVHGDVKLNIIIRTLIETETQMLVGAGGGIVALSDPAFEFDEMMLKAMTVIGKGNVVDDAIPP